MISNLGNLTDNQCFLFRVLDCYEDTKTLNCTRGPDGLDEKCQCYPHAGTITGVANLVFATLEFSLSSHNDMVSVLVLRVLKPKSDKFLARAAAFSN
jgi:hypothetical protein